MLLPLLPWPRLVVIVLPARATHFLPLLLACKLLLGSGNLLILAAQLESCRREHDAGPLRHILNRLALRLVLRLQ